MTNDGLDTARALALDADDLFREQVREARRQPIEDKAFAGAELFDLAVGFTMAGIRAEHPDADGPRALDLLRERLDLARRLEDAP
ncbi:MAG: hypothetical protein HOP29_04695 [Phycisphaerales bacterium]|nr:hypothetical protein [Phycisphaerales bacterium]